MHNVFCIKIQQMRLILILAGMALTVACGNNEQSGHEGHDRTNGYSDKPETAMDSLYEQVMAGHDIGMAKMGKIKGALTQTQARLDSLNALPRNPTIEAKMSELVLLKEGLSYAEMAMNTWMEEFQPDSGSNDAAVRKAYLESELAKVNKVKESILTSVQKADSIFAKN